MNPLMQLPGQPPGKFWVGQRVRILHGRRGKIAEIVEDRGPILAGGRRLYGIRLRLDPWNEIVTELPEESLEAVDGDTESVSQRDIEAAPTPPSVQEENPAYYLMQLPGQPPGKFRVGQRVRILHGRRGKIAEIVEDRGAILAGGRRLYGIRLRLDPWNEIVTELPEESLEAVDGEPDSTDGKKERPSE